MTDISRLEELLRRLDNCVVERKHQVQVCCDGCQALLRPWPSKVKEKHKEMNTDDPQPDGPRQEAVPEVTPEELQAVSLVDKLLTKAQRARNTQRKVHAAGKHTQPENLCKAGSSEEINTADKTPPPQEPHPQLPPSHSLQASDGPAKNELQTQTPASGTAAFGHQKRLPPIASQTSSSESRPPLEAQQKARSQPSSQPSSGRAQGHRPGSARLTAGRQSAAARGRAAPPQSSSAPLTRQSSAGRRSGPKPVHTSAPFKTDPHLRMPSRQKNPPPKLAKGRSNYQPEVFLGKKKSQMKSVGGAGRNEKVRGRVGEDPVEFPPVVILGDGTVLDGTEVPGSTLDTDNKDSEQRTQSDSQGDVLSSSFGDCRTVAENTSGNYSSKRDEEKKNEAKPSQAISNSQLPDKPASSTGADHEAEGSSQKPFLLQRDGRTLSIPIRLRRLFASNCQLRAKLRSALMTRKVDDTDMGKAFAARLEDQMEGESALRRQQGFQRCLHEHTGLLELMHSLQLPALSDASSPEDVYRAKVIVEYILTRFNELQDEAEHFVKGQPVAASGADLLEVDTDTSSLEEWFHGNATHKGATPSATLAYRNSQQLQRWRHLQFQHQLLRFHCSLADLALNLLPLLHSMGPQSREYIPVFRAIFSLLTSQGQHLPALVATSS